MIPFNSVDRLLRRTPLWVLPLIAAVLLSLPAAEIVMTDDGSGYMIAGLNLHLGRGYTFADGVPVLARPLFSLWLALFFKLFGASDQTAFAAVRVFYIANTMLLYALATWLYDRWAGLLAALMVLTSLSLSSWATLVHLDFVLPALILLYFLILLRAFEGQSLLMFCAAGLVLGLAYLVKEVAILFSPLPFLMLAGVGTFRTRRAALGSGLCWLVFLLVIGAWWVYTYLDGGYFLPLGTRAGTTLSDTMARQAQSRGLGWYLSSLQAYYRNQIAPYFGLAPALAAAWLPVAVLAVRNRSERILLLAAACWLPMLLLQGSEGFRPRQGVVFFFLSYVALAGVIWRGLNLIRGRALIPEGSKSSHDPIARHSDLPVRLKSLLNFVLAVTIIIGFVALQWRSEQGAWWGYARAYNLFGFLAHGWPHIQNPTATWFLAEAEPGSRVLNNQRFAARRLYFKTGGEFPVHSFLPHVPPDLRDRLDKASRTDPKVVRILYLQPTGGLGTGSLARRAYEAYLEEDLLGSIRSHEIRYLIVSNAVNGFLALYAELSPYFVQVAQPTPDIRVYRVDKEVLPLADWEIRIDPGIHAALKELRDESPEAYDRLVGEYFRDLLGLSPSEIEKLESGPYSQLGTESFTEDTFVRLLQGQGQHALEAAVALHREKAERIPGNPYPYLTLGALYAGMGDQEAAIDAYRRAGSVATDRVRAYLTLGQDYRPPAQPESRGEESVYATDRILDRIGPDLAAGQVSDQVHPSVFLVAGEPRRVLFQHPPSRISYRLQPSSSSYFRFGLSLDPEVWQPDKGDGVRFDLFVDDGNGSSHPYSQYIDPKTVPSDRMWHDGEIALSPWAGQAITLTLATSAGPAANSAYDWAGWGEPRVLQPAAFDFLATLPHADRGARGAKAVRQDVLTLGSEERTILFQHPPNRTTFQLAMPRRAGLHFGVGMDPRVWDPEKGDGVEYSIYVRDPDVPGVLHRVFNRYIDPKNDPADRRWYDAVVDLTAYGGKTVDVIFEALAGPAGDDGYDWGGWSWPVLIGDDMALRPRDWTGLILSEGDVP